jgi:hypothetical protein
MRRLIRVQEIRLNWGGEKVTTSPKMAEAARALAKTCPQRWRIWGGGFAPTATLRMQLHILNLVRV